MQIRTNDLKKGIQNPLLLIKYCLKQLDKKFKISNESRVINNGERIILKNWKNAKNTSNITAILHIKRYEWVKSFLRNLEVLDCGCGTGYGTHYLASNKIKKILGIDIHYKAIKYAQKNYVAKNLLFISMNSLSMQFKNHIFDTVVTFDVIEHIEKKDHPKFFKEIIRVLKNRGTLFISTPNSYYTVKKNPHHLYEYSLNEFESILKRHFEEVNLLGQNISINGKVINKYWRKYLNFLSGSNILIDECATEKSLIFIAICRNPHLNLK